MRRLAPSAVVALLAVSCTSAGGGDGIKPLPETTTTTTQATGASYAVPAVIDTAYIDRVLAALDQVEGDAVRGLVAGGDVDAESVARLRAIYNDPEFERARSGLLETGADGVGEFKQPPGNRRTTVTQVLTASPTCILVEATTDFSAVATSPPPLNPAKYDLFTMRPSRAENDPAQLNPTPWSYSNAEVITRGNPIPPRAACD